MAVDFRGLPACTCQATWLPAYEHELQRRGLMVGPLRIFQLIGGNPSSGGTHTGGGAADLLDLPGTEDVWVARQMGADPTWARPFNWDGAGGIAHIHSVLRGCPHLSPSAAAQIVAVDNNGDGLVGDAPDPGPRPLSGRTWQQGIEWQRQQEESDVFTPEDKVWLTAMVDARLVAFGKNAGDLVKLNNPTDPKKPKWSLSTMTTSLFKRTGGTP